MKTTKTISNLEGYFGVRQWSQNGTPREQRPFIPQGQNITFGIKFDSRPVDFANFAQEKHRADGSVYWWVNIKISRSCNWITAENISLGDNFPVKYEELDGKRYEVNIRFAELPVDPSNPKKASGYWADAIAFRMIDNIDDLLFDNVQAEPAYEQPAQTDNWLPSAQPAPAVPSMPAAPSEQSLPFSNDDNLPF